MGEAAKVPVAVAADVFMLIVIVGLASLSTGIFVGCALMAVSARSYQQQTEKALLELTKTHVDLDELTKATAQLAQLNEAILLVMEQQQTKPRQATTPQVVAYDTSSGNKAH